MKLRKILSLGLIAAMTLSLVACGSKEADKKESDNTLTMATNAAFPPYEYYEGNEITGIDAEIGKAIADELGMEFEIEDMEFDSIIAAVVSNKADIGMAGMTVTEDRKKNVNFTDSYTTAVQVIIVTEDSEVTSADDFEGKGIGVQQGTTGDIYVTDDFGDKATVERYNKGTEAVEALKQGKIDAVVIDNEPAKAFVAENEGLKILETEYVTEEYAIAISKDNDELLEKVNDALNKLIEDGTVQEIIDKYIDAE